jgi:hypothetical protein
MDNLNEKIYSKIIAIIMVVITIAITSFIAIIMTDIKEIKDGIDDLKILDQLERERKYIADEFDDFIKGKINYEE